MNFDQTDAFADAYGGGDGDGRQVEKVHIRIQARNRRKCGRACACKHLV